MKYGLARSVSPRMSAASSVCSDDSFEIVSHEVDVEDTKDSSGSLQLKVTFLELFDVYPKDTDIVAKVVYDKDFHKSDKDTVMLLRTGWHSKEEALCAASIHGNFVRFDVKDLPKIGPENELYHMCYYSEDKLNVGISAPFSFREVHECELVEFPKEQHKEFWTFRSRFAVLMDNYWNTLMEKVAQDRLIPEASSYEETKQESSSKNVTGGWDVDENKSKNCSSLGIERMSLEKDQKSPWFHEKLTYYNAQLEKQENNMKADYDKVLHERDQLSENLKEVKGQLESSIRNENFLKHQFNELQAEVMKLNDKLHEAEQTAADMAAMKYELQDTITILGDELLMVLIHGVFKNESIPTDALDKLIHANGYSVYPEGRERVEQMIRANRNKDEKAEVAFVAASNGDIMVADLCPKEVPTNTESIQRCVPESSNDKQEMESQLKQSVEMLQEEKKELENIIRDLNEKLINQRQGEVEKMLSVTNNMRDNYDTSLNKLASMNKVLADKLLDKDKEIEVLNDNILDMGKLLTANEQEIQKLKARDLSLVGFLERRNLKRISELEETLQQVYSKMWNDNQESAKVKEELHTSRALFNSMWDEKRKHERRSKENSVQTVQPEGDETSGSATESSSAQENIWSNQGASSVGFQRLKKREQRMAAKLVEMTSQLVEVNSKLEDTKSKLEESVRKLEEMTDIHNKCKTELEVKLKESAKAYAKLYMKYEKQHKQLLNAVLKPSESITHEDQDNFAASLRNSG